jgi:hypothetical protein
MSKIKRLETLRLPEVGNCDVTTVYKNEEFIDVISGVVEGI